MTPEELAKEIKRRRKNKWVISSFNTTHLVERLRTHGAILHGDEWLLPDQHTYEGILRHIEFTATHLTEKFCPGCGGDKAIEDFPADENQPDGRAKLCVECARKEREEKSGRVGSKWREARKRRFSGAATRGFPPINERLYARYSRRRTFPGSMALANALLWWEQVDVTEGPHLFPHNYFPLDVMHKIVEDTGYTWGAHLRLTKQILNNVYNKHWQNQAGVGYRIATDLAHDGIEAAKLHDLIRTFSFAVYRRLDETWGLFPDAPEDTKDVLRKLFNMTQAHTSNLSAWSRVFYRSFYYLKERVGAGSLSIPEVVRISDEEISGELDAVFTNASDWFKRWANSLGYEVHVKRRRKRR
jgi:hypothetical protein